MASAALLEILETEDFFLRLGLPPRQKAAPADVRKSYRKRALLCHPDKSTHPQAGEAFGILAAAFEALHTAASDGPRGVSSSDGPPAKRARREKRWEEWEREWC